MAKAPISRFSVPNLDELTADIRERIQAVSQKTGFVPNVFLALARRPDEFRAFFAYYDAVMLREGGLTKAEKEMLVVATSAANQCPYCVIAHGALVRLFSKNPLLGDQIAVNYRAADLDRRQRAMLDAALKLATAPQSFGEDDIQNLLACGFTKEDVWDIGAITSLFESDGASHGHASERRVLRPGSEPTVKHVHALHRAGRALEGSPTGRVPRADSAGSWSGAPARLDGCSAP